MISNIVKSKIVNWFLYLLPIFAGEFIAVNPRFLYTNVSKIGAINQRHPI